MNQRPRKLLDQVRDVVEVLEIDPGPVDAIRARKPRRLPHVLTRKEVIPARR